MLVEVFGRGGERPGFRVVHYSVQTNHMHFLVEACNRHSLSRWLGGLATRMARQLNRL